MQGPQKPQNKAQFKQFKASKNDDWILHKRSFPASLPMTGGLFY